MNLQKLFIVTALFFGTSGYVNASNNAFSNTSADAVIEPNNTPGIRFANAILEAYEIEGYNGKISSSSIHDISSRKDLELDVTQNLYPEEVVGDEELVRRFRILAPYFGNERNICTITEDVTVKKNVQDNGCELITHTGGLFEVVRYEGKNVLTEHKNLKSIELRIVDSSFSIFYGMISPNCLLFNLVITQVDSSEYLFKNNIILDTGKIVLR